MGAHLDRVIDNCASSRFALRTLRAHGLPPPELHLVTRMTTVSSLMYAWPSWWGFADASSASWRVLDGPGFFHLTFRHSTNLHGMLTLACSGQSAPTRTVHVLRHYFTVTGHNLRPRTKSFALLSKDSRNFVSRTLYIWSLPRTRLKQYTNLTIIICQRSF